MKNTIGARGGWRAARFATFPPRVWTLAALELASAVVLVVSALHPLSPEAPVRIGEISAGYLAAAGAANLVWAGKVRDKVLLAQAAGGVAITVALVAESGTPGGTLLSCAGFLWVALWVALFFAPRLLVATVGGEAVGTIVAAGLSRHPGWAIAAGGSVVAIAALAAATLAWVVTNLRNLALKDQLTGLLNRHGLDVALARLEKGRQSGPTSLIAIDMDGLKEVNDHDGHHAGDALLSEFAADLDAAAGRTGVAARVGGDEFVVILPTAAAGQARRWAADFRAGSRSSWSFGVAERRPGESFHAWHKRADHDMYRAKVRSTRRPRSA